jgi:hypothetical protein
MPLNFIKAWRNDKYNKIVLIWRFTLVLIKINYGQIGDQTGLFHTALVSGKKNIPRYWYI